MAKIKTAIERGEFSRPTVRRNPATKAEHEQEMLNLFSDLYFTPAKVVKNWYAEYIQRRDKLSEEVDMTDDWYERTTGI